MSKLQEALAEAGLLDIVTAKATSLGTSIEEAMRQVFLEDASKQPTLVPGTPEFKNAVLARLTDGNATCFAIVREMADAKAKRQVEDLAVYLFAISGKVALSLADQSELDEIEEAIDYVTGQ